MSHIRIKTTYNQQKDPFGNTEILTLYCDHNLSSDFVTFYDENGNVENMIFQEWEYGKNKWDAVERLMFPFLEEDNNKLINGVEYCKFPFEK